MGKSLGSSLAKPDDPIFKEKPTFYTRPSDRGSTPSTESSPTSTDSKSNPESETPDEAGGRRPSKTGKAWR